MSATLDSCVRAVTAFQSFEDLMDTQPTYAPTFYARHVVTDFECEAIERVVKAFNRFAERTGRARRAEIRS